MAARPLACWLRIRIPLFAWMSVCCECCVLSGRGLCVGMITRPEESYRVWCFWVWSWNLYNEKPWPTGGCCAMGKRKRNRLTLSLMTTSSRRPFQEVASRRLCTKDRRNSRLHLYKEELRSETNLRQYEVINKTGPVFPCSKPSRTVQVLTLPTALVNRRPSSWLICLFEHKLFLLFNDFNRPCNYALVILEYDTPLCLSCHFKYTVTHEHG